MHLFCYYATKFTCHKHGKVRTASQSFSSSILARDSCMYMHCVAAWSREISAILIGWTRVATPELNSSQLERSVTSLVGVKSCSQYDVAARRNATLFPASYCEPAFSQTMITKYCTLCYYKQNPDNIVVCIAQRLVSLIILFTHCSINVSRALIIGVSKHGYDTDEDGLYCVNGKPSLLWFLVAPPVLPWFM